MIRLSRTESINEILNTILSSGIARSLTGKAFIINLIPEIGAAIYFWSLKPLEYIFPCIFMIMIAYIIENIMEKGWRDSE